jgi:hypothetical protein
MARFNKSPYELLFGVEGQIPFLRKGNLQGSYSRMAKSHIENHARHLKKIRKDMLSLKKLITQRELDKANKKRLELKIKPGSSAMIHTKGTRHKTECVWSDLVEVISAVNESTYVVRYPSGMQIEVPADRLRVITPWDRSAEAAAGPFFEDYPRMLFEGDSPGKVHEAKLEELPSCVIPTEEGIRVFGPARAPGRRLTSTELKNEDSGSAKTPESKHSEGTLTDTEEEAVQEISTTDESSEEEEEVSKKSSYHTMSTRGGTRRGHAKAEKLKLTFGDFVAYTADGTGWYIGQYLQQELGVPEDSITLRGMFTYQRVLLAKKLDALAVTWHYVWVATKGKCVLAEIHRLPNEKPLTRNAQLEAYPRSGSRSRRHRC